MPEWTPEKISLEIVLIAAARSNEKKQISNLLTSLLRKNMAEFAQATVCRMSRFVMELVMRSIEKKTILIMQLIQIGKLTNWLLM